ncbi:MAG: hypothetical protein JSW40_04985, partial [Candidatus Omnitrophota bacterium]
MDFIQVLTPKIIYKLKKGFLNILFVYKEMNYNKSVIKGLFLKSCMKTQTTQTQIKEKLEKEFSDEASEIEIRHI